jgi:phosphoketolase
LTLCRVAQVLRLLPGWCRAAPQSLAPIRACIEQRLRDQLVEHAEYIVQRDTDMAEVANWNWPY